MTYSNSQLQEYSKCHKSFEYFSETYLGYKSIHLDESAGKIHEVTEMKARAVILWNLWFGPKQMILAICPSLAESHTFLDNIKSTYDLINDHHLPKPFVKINNKREFGFENGSMVRIGSASVYAGRGLSCSLVYLNRLKPDLYEELLPSLIPMLYHTDGKLLVTK